MKLNAKQFVNVTALAGTIVMASSATPTPGQTILIDFGSATSWRGLNVANPDVNGRYWNSMQPGLYYSGLIDIFNAATTINFGFSTPVGTDSYNGPAGPTSNPPTPAEIAATDIDAAALGNLGATNAAIDFAAGSGGVCKFEIQHLDPTKKYDLTFYGSHKFNTDANTVYSVYSDNTYTTVVGQTNLNVFQPGSPWLHNRNTTATISNLSPQANNIFYVTFVGSAGGDGYLNCMQISVAQAVSVAPTITSQSYDPATHQFTLTWTSSASASYTVLYTSDLTAAMSPLVTGIVSGGTTTTTTVIVPVGNAGFVRIKQE
jgi:hypothetical protein